MDWLNEIDWNQQLADHWPVLASYALKVVGAFFVIIIGLRIAGWLANLVKKQAMKRETVDQTLGSFFASLVRWFMTAAVFIAALQVFGVQATSFVAVLGALTLAIGLSLQGALGNVASGVMIMLFRPYSLGNFVEIAGEQGTVKEINLFQTILATTDNIQVIVPNSQAIDGVIKNYAGYNTRRIDLTIGVDYGDGLDKAISVIEGVVNANSSVLDDPAPVVRVDELGASSVDITVRSWVNTPDYHETKWALTKTIKETLDREGISIPYPHTVMVQKAG